MSQQTVGQVRYPWEQWLSRKRVRLQRGRDYHCMTHSMAVQIRTAAYRLRKKVSVLIDDDGITVLMQKAA